MRRLLLAAVALFCLLAVPVSAYAAYDPLSDVCKAGGGAGSSSAACSANSGNPFTAPNGPVHKVINVLSMVGAIMAVVLIMYGGFRYITAAGDASKLTNARNVIIGAVVGLVIIALAQAIVIFVIGRLVAK